MEDTPNTPSSVCSCITSTSRILLFDITECFTRAGIPLQMLSTCRVENGLSRFTCAGRLRGVSDPPEAAATVDAQMLAALGTTDEGRDPKSCTFWQSGATPSATRLSAAGCGLSPGAEGTVGNALGRQHNSMSPHSQHAPQTTRDNRQTRLARSNSTSPFCPTKRKKNARPIRESRRPKFFVICLSIHGLRSCMTISRMPNSKFHTERIRRGQSSRISCIRETTVSTASATSRPPEQTASAA
mmetsp:Transcript_31073/g.95091  ORF Transcript_31073/g.95091 Transcript_31073/m.95091 type:complete len:242 (-) Transcript_31073:39-764(-)|eukprot:scaffold316874_cov26-Tisochrysis_lutea.AAC.1